MQWISFEDLPSPLQREEVWAYYQSLDKKRGSLVVKRMADIVLSLLLLVVFSPFMLLLGLLIYWDSPGPIFYRQERISQYGRPFQIIKFRTMVADADQKGLAITAWEDSRITRLGRILRKLHIDEVPQLVNVLKGEMSLVGVRPEVPRYVAQYTPEMWATLLLPAGMLSRCSIVFKDENELQAGVADPEKKYLEEILPAKMAINLDEMKKFSLGRDIKILWDSLLTVFY